MSVKADVIHLDKKRCVDRMCKKSLYSITCTGSMGLISDQPLVAGEHPFFSRAKVRPFSQFVFSLSLLLTRIIEKLIRFASKCNSMGIVQFVFSKYFFRQILVAVLFFGLLTFLIFKSLGIITHHAEKIEVPDLAKKNIEEVKRVLKDMDLRYIVQDSSEYNPNFPRQSVIRQEPMPGDIVKSNRKIYLTLNASGYRMVTIPEFLGKTKRNVESTFKAIGFDISDKPIYVPDLGKDVVRGIMYKGEKVQAGEQLPKKTELTLVLGKGTEDQPMVGNSGQ